MSNTLSIIATQQTELVSLSDRTVVYDGGKKGLREITAHGACFKGGKAFAALRDAAAEDALSRALIGRYRAAADIVATLMPASDVAGFDKYVMRGKGWASMNKNDFQRLCEAALLVKMPKSGKWNAKQETARELATVYLEQHPLLTEDKPLTIDQ